MTLLVASGKVADGTTTTLGGGHVVHLVGALAFFVLTIGGVALSEHLQRSPRPRLSAERRSWVILALALAGIVAAGVHYAVMPEHFAEAPLYGTFFAVTATSQLGYSLLVVLRSSPLLLATGVAGNLALVTLWLLTRTVGIPLGPNAGSTEAFGALDIVASGCEALMVVLGVSALVLLPRSVRSKPRSYVPV